MKHLIWMVILFAVPQLSAQATQKLGIGVTAPFAFGADYQSTNRIGFYANILPFEVRRGAEIGARYHIVQLPRSSVIITGGIGYLKTRSGFEGLSYGVGAGLDWNWGILSNVPKLNRWKSNFYITLGEADASLNINGGLYYLIK